MNCTMGLGLWYSRGKQPYGEGKSIFINDFACAIDLGLIIYLHEGSDLSHGYFRSFERVLVPLTYAQQILTHIWLHKQKQQALNWLFLKFIL